MVTACYRHSRSQQKCLTAPDPAPRAGCCAKDGQIPRGQAARVRLSFWPQTVCQPFARCRISTLSSLWTALTCSHSACIAPVTARPLCVQLPAAERLAAGACSSSWQGPQCLQPCLWHPYCWAAQGPAPRVLLRLQSTCLPCGPPSQAVSFLQGRHRLAGGRRATCCSGSDLVTRVS